MGDESAQRLAEIGHGGVWFPGLWDGVHSVGGGGRGVGPGPVTAARKWTGCPFRGDDRWIRRCAFGLLGQAVRRRCHMSTPNAQCLTRRPRVRNASTGRGDPEPNAATGRVDLEAPPIPLSNRCPPRPDRPPRPKEAPAGQAITEIDPHHTSKLRTPPTHPARRTDRRTRHRQPEHQASPSGHHNTHTAKPSRECIPPGGEGGRATTADGRDVESASKAREKRAWKDSGHAGVSKACSGKEVFAPPVAGGFEAGRDGEEAAAGVSDVFVQAVLRAQSGLDRHELLVGVLLVGDEEQPGVE